MKRGLWSKVLTFLGFEEEEYVEEAAVAPEARAVAQPSREAGFLGRRSFFSDELSARRDRRPQLVPIPGGGQGPRSGMQRALIWEPASFDEVQDIADYLRQGHLVLLNTEHVDRHLAGRIINFLNGSVYALGGVTHKVSQHVLLFAPEGIDVERPNAVDTPLWEDEDLT